MPPDLRNHLEPTGGDTPASRAASSLERPVAIAAQNRTSSSRRAESGRPGKCNLLRPDRSDRRLRTVIATSYARVLRRPIELALRAAIRMVDAARRGPPRSNGRFERRYGETRIDRSADRIAHDPARPGIEDDRDIDEADSDRDVGDVGDPELVRPVSRDVLGKVGEDRPVMIAVSGGDEALAAPGLQVVFRASDGGPSCC